MSAVYGLQLDHNELTLVLRLLNTAASADESSDAERVTAINLIDYIEELRRRRP